MLIKLIDGTCETRKETFDKINVEWIKQCNGYIGRQRNEFLYVLDIIRDSNYEVSQIYLEAMILYGFFSSKKIIVYLINVGGTLFHLRKSIIERIPYINSLIKYDCLDIDKKTDFSSLLIDRNPEKFKQILSYVEVYGDTLLLKKEADFYNICYSDKICFSCRKENTLLNINKICPYDHKTCKKCYNGHYCNICFQSLIDSQTRCYTDICNFNEVQPLASLIAKGHHDIKLIGKYRYYNFKETVNVTNTTFTFYMEDFIYDQRYWICTIPQNTCVNLLGDSWLYLYVNNDIPSDKWLLYQLISELIFTISDYEIEKIDGSILYFLDCMDENHIEIVHINETETLIILPLLFFWWNQKYKIPLTTFNKCVIKLLGNNDYQIKKCKLVYTGISLCHDEMQSLHDQYDNIIIIHKSYSLKIIAECTNYVHIHNVYLSYPTKDIILLVRNNNYIHFPSEPIKLIEIFLNNHRHMSIDGIFSRKILANKYYGLNCNENKNIYIYVLPFDHLLRRSQYNDNIYSVSTINFSRIDTCKIKLLMEKGNYSINVISRHINIIKYMYGLASFIFSP